MHLFFSNSQSCSRDLYTLEEINDFLDKTLKSVKVSDYFSDVEKFLKSVLTLQKNTVRKILSKLGSESMDTINTKHLFLARKRQVHTTYQEAGSELSDSQNYTIAIYIIYVYWPHNVMGN